MSRDGNEPKDATLSPYDEAMEALSSLITKRSRADNSNMGDRFDLLFDYVKMLELEEPIKQMKIIHVAGTKGKGSTCTFSESILRNCGFRTGLFTSPHLIDVRERFRLDGLDVCEEKFLAYFWWCWVRLKERTSEEVPMPTYFRFLALLAFKIFASEQVDVAILEVGLGGKFDATNVVENPIVCGIASLGYDHMEILGNTLGQIAGEKAGIFKTDVPAFTVPQREEAMSVLKEKASLLHVHLQITAPLDPILLSGMQLGLEGEHQYVNAGLAIALCSTWLQRTGHVGINYLNQTTSLPEEFIKGLATASLQGRAQIVPDQFIESENPEDLVFYLDGAHSPESMEVCAKWFCLASKGDANSQPMTEKNDSTASPESRLLNNYGTSRINYTQILLFNCMPVRDPQLLLPRLMDACSRNGVHFKRALFVPNTSLSNKVGTAVASPRSNAQVDLSWQLTLQKLWESLTLEEKVTKNIVESDCLPVFLDLFNGIYTSVDHDLFSGKDAKPAEFTYEESPDIIEKGGNSCENSAVFSSLPVAINWIRESVRKNQSVRFQVLVTGSLHLVGDVLRIIKK